MATRKRSSTTWKAEGGEHWWRSPFLQGGKWRVRRRRKLTHEVECLTLEGVKSRTDARLRVQELAAEERRLAEEALRAPGQGRQEDLALGEALPRWVATLDVRPATQVGYKGVAENLARLLGASKAVREIGFPELEALFGGPWRALSARSKVFYRWFLVRFFDWALDSGLTGQNPARKVRIQRAWRRDLRRAGDEPGQALDAEECRRLLRAAREPVLVRYERRRLGRKEEVEAERAARDGLFWFLLISLKTGLRKSNVVGSNHKSSLLWSDLDLERGLLSIEGERMKNGEDLRVPLNAELWAELRALASSLGRVPGKEAVIRLPAGADLRKSFASCLARAGLAERRLRVHDLRHSFLTLLGRVTPEMPMALLAGHLPKTMTQLYGMHLGIEDLRPWVDKLPRLLPVASGSKGLDTARLGR